MSNVAGSWKSHRVQKGLVDGIAWLTYREVEIDGAQRAEEGPVLIVANHFGGAADAVVLMSALSRRPRILADEKIWKVPVARQMMDWLGAIQVRRGKARSGGGSGGADNSDMFSECHDALGKGEMVLIFPEGITREEPSIGKVRSGAARIALGARTSGVSGVRILPVGIHYDDKAAFRSSVFVNVGEPIDVDEILEQYPATVGREDVEHLTELIAERLRLAAPDYEDWTQARSLQMASEAFMRTLVPNQAVPVRLRDRLASWMARGGDPALADAGSHYRARLLHAGVNDAWVAGGRRKLNLRAVLKFLGFLLLIPYALIGIGMHLLPIALTWLITKLKLAPAVMATVMPLATAVFFGAAFLFWLVAGFNWKELEGLVAVFVLFPVSFFALVVVTERIHLWLRGFRNRLFVWGGERADLGTERARVVSAVGDSVNADLDAA